MQLPDGSFRSLPVGWTDLMPVDPYVAVGGGRSRFRIEDLLELVELIRRTAPEDVKVNYVQCVQLFLSRDSRGFTPWSPRV